MMYFRQIRDAIINVLGNAANGQYRVLGYQERTNTAEEVLDTDRLVQVYYSRGNYPQSSAALRGPYNHKMVFKVQMEVSKMTEVDLSVLQNPTATAEEIQAAWLALKPAEQAADEALDELWDYVFQAVMDASQIDFGLSFEIGSRWIDNFVKESVLPRGEYAVLTATAEITCNIDEVTSGLQPVPLQYGDIDVVLDGDDYGKAGVAIENTYIVDQLGGNVLTDNGTNYLVS